MPGCDENGFILVSKPHRWVFQSPVLVLLWQTSVEVIRSYWQVVIHGEVISVAVTFGTRRNFLVAARVSRP